MSSLYFDDDFIYCQASRATLAVSNSESHRGINVRLTLPWRGNSIQIIMMEPRRSDLQDNPPTHWPWTAPQYHMRLNASKQQSMWERGLTFLEVSVIHLLIQFGPKCSFFNRTWKSYRRVGKIPFFFPSTTIADLITCVKEVTRGSHEG